MRNKISKKLKRAIQLEIKHSIVMRDFDHWEAVYEDPNPKLGSRILINPYQNKLQKADERSYEAYLDLNQSEKDYMDSRNWYPKECETYEEALEYYK